MQKGRVSDRTSVTLKLFLFASIVLVPSITAMNLSFSNAIKYVTQLSINEDIEGALKNNIQTMQKLKPYLNASEQTDLLTVFQRDLETLQAYASLRQVREALNDEIHQHSFLIVLAALLISLVLALVLAKNIVSLFTGLSRALQLKERESASLAALENWQSVSQSVIHELRSGLTPIRLVSDRIGKGNATSPPPSDHHNVDLEIRAIILNEVKKMEELIENLTEFASLPKVNLQTKNFAETLAYFKANFALPGIRVCGAAIDEFLTLRHDPGMVQRLLFNHLRNAKEANIGIEDLHLELNITTTSTDVYLHIKDNGKGLKEEQLTSIFSQGYTGEKEKPAQNMRLSANMGLGLAISKKIALEHHGDLFVVPSNSGAHFVFRLPLIISV